MNFSHVSILGSVGGGGGSYKTFPFLLLGVRIFLGTILGGTKFMGNFQITSNPPPPPIAHTLQLLLQIFFQSVHFTIILFVCVV